VDLEVAIRTVRLARLLAEEESKTACVWEEWMGEVLTWDITRVDPAPISGACVLILWDRHPMEAASSC